MALPNELGSGGTGFHGEQSVAVRQALAGAVTATGDLETNLNLLLAKLDADGGVGDTDYVSTLGVTPVTGTGLNVSFADGGSFAHGEGGQVAGRAINTLVGGGAAIEDGLVAVRAKLDADTTDGGYVAGGTVTGDAAGALHNRFGDGAAGAHGEEGRVGGRAIGGLDALLTAATTDFNDLLAALDVDSLVTDTDYVATLGL